MDAFSILKGFQCPYHRQRNPIPHNTTDPWYSDMPDTQQDQGSSGITTALDIHRPDDFNNEDISGGLKWESPFFGRDANFYAFNLEIMKE